MKYSLWVVIYFLAFMNSYGVDIKYLDSLKSELNQPLPVKARLACLYSLSYEYGYLNPTVGIQYGRLCLNEATLANDTLYVLCAYNGIANCYETLSLYDSARYYHQASYNVSILLKNKEKQALTLSNIAICEKKQGNYQLALEYYLKCYRIFDNLSSYNPRVDEAISDLYNRIGKYELAEYYAKKGINRIENTAYHYIIPSLLYQVAICQVQRRNIDSAIVTLNDALKILSKEIDEVITGKCLAKLGEIYMFKKDYSSAYYYFKQAIHYFKKLKNTSGILQSSANCATAAIAIGKSKKEILELLQSAESNILLMSQQKDVLLDAFEGLSKVYEQLGNFKKALYFKKEAYALYDTLLGHDRYGQLQELQTIYETQKKENEIIALKKQDLENKLQIVTQQAINKTRTIILSSSLILLGLIAWLIYLSKQKQKVKLHYETQLAIKASQEEERLRVGRDIHDDFGSGLSKINFLSEAILNKSHLEPTTRENTQAIADTAKQLVVNMRDLIWILYPENITTGNLLARIREFSSEYLEDYNLELVLNINSKTESTQICKEAHREVLMVLKESLNNIVKHAKATQVSIDAGTTNTYFYLTVKDNGIGFDKDTRKGRGLHNMKERVATLKGLYQIESINGTCVQIQIPILENKKST